MLSDLYDLPLTTTSAAARDAALYPHLAVCWAMRPFRERLIENTLRLCSPLP
jgi:hypothetical protein